MCHFLRLISALWFGCFAAIAHAQEVAIVPTEGAVTAVIATGRGYYIETTRGTYSLTQGQCTGGICLQANVVRGLPAHAPDGALPDGKIATSTTGDIVRAWYGQPTTRYNHGVLGDAIEAGALVVETVDGQRHELTLPQEFVFEDITPRLHDFASDGRNEIVTIRASQTGGAAVVIYGLRDGALVERLSSAENGQRNRWLNIAAIVDNTVHFIRTPHIGGRWSTLGFAADGRAERRDDIRTGLSNHVIGSRELDLSEVFTRDGATSIFVPSQDRKSLLDLLGRRNAIALPSAVDKAVISVGDTLVSATDDGRLLAIKP